MVWSWLLVVSLGGSVFNQSSARGTARENIAKEGSYHDWQNAPDSCSVRHRIFFLDAGRTKPRPVQRSHRGPAPETGTAELVDVPRHLQWFRLQPARPDQYAERQEAHAGVELFHGDARRTPSAAHREQRRHVRHNAERSGAGVRRQEWRPVVALRKGASRGRHTGAPD